MQYTHRVPKQSAQHQLLHALRTARRSGMTVDDITRLVRLSAPKRPPVSIVLHRVEAGEYRHDDGWRVFRSENGWFITAQWDVNVSDAQYTRLQSAGLVGMAHATLAQARDSLHLLLDDREDSEALDDLLS